jgi:hypothetical protein
MPYEGGVDKPLHTVAFTAGFLRQSEAEGMGQKAVEALVDLLCAEPAAGDLIQGSGGCRKVRIAGKGRGKSGGFRVVTFFARENMPVYVFAVLSKGSRENFNANEVAAMAKAAKAILALNQKASA